MATAVVPARERLESGDAAARQLDQRLKGEVEPVFFDRVAQLGFESEAIVRQHRGFGFVDFDAVGLLGALERDLRMADLIGDIGVNRGLNRAAERAVDADFQFTDAERMVEAAADAPRHFAHIGAAARDAGRNGEFVAAGARQYVAAAQTRFQSPRDGDDQLVACHRADMFVDAAEPGEVEQQDRMVTPRAVGAAALFDQLLESGAIG